MESAQTSARAHNVLRPTQLVAEALIDRHDPEELISRARQLGYSRDLTRTVVAVCCPAFRASDEEPDSSAPAD